MPDALQLAIAPFVLRALRDRARDVDVVRRLELPYLGCWTLLVVEQGPLRIELPGGTRLLRSGQAMLAHAGCAGACVMPPRCRHRRIDFDIVHRTHRRLAFGWRPEMAAPVQPTPAELWGRDPAMPLPGELFGPALIVAREITDTAWRSDRDHLRCNLLLAGWLARLHAHCAEAPTAAVASDDPLASAERVARESFAYGATTRTMAEAAGLGLRAFERRWRAAHGEPPGVLLRRLRYGYACSLLEAGKSVHEAALQAGFRSVPSFARGFRSLHGTSPAEWRRRRRGLG